MSKDLVKSKAIEGIQYNVTHGRVNLIILIEIKFSQSYKVPRANRMIIQIKTGDRYEWFWNRTTHLFSVTLKLFHVYP